jgi:hypothetical protein
MLVVLEFRTSKTRTRTHCSEAPQREASHRVDPAFLALPSRETCRSYGASKHVLRMEHIVLAHRFVLPQPRSSRDRATRFRRGIEAKGNDIPCSPAKVAGPTTNSQLVLAWTTLVVVRNHCVGFFRAVKVTSYTTWLENSSSWWRSAFGLLVSLSCTDFLLIFVLYWTLSDKPGSKRSNTAPSTRDTRFIILITWSFVAAENIPLFYTMSSPAGSPSFPSSLRLKIPSGLPVSPSPHVRAHHDNGHEHSSLAHCEQCVKSRNMHTNITTSTPEPSPPLEPEQSRLFSFTEQLSRKLRLPFLKHSWNERKKERRNLEERSPKMEYVQISPTRDWTAD